MIGREFFTPGLSIRGLTTSVLRPEESETHRNLHDFLQLLTPYRMVKTIPNEPGQPEQALIKNHALEAIILQLHELMAHPKDFRMVGTTRTDHLVGLLWFAAPDSKIHTYNLTQWGLILNPSHLHQGFSAKQVATDLIANIPAALLFEERRAISMLRFMVQPADQNYMRVIAGDLPGISYRQISYLDRGSRTPALAQGVLTVQVKS